MRDQTKQATITAMLQPGHAAQALHAELLVESRDLLVEKRRYSAFIQGSSDLDARLRALGVDTVVIAGTLTNVCCESTARDAMMHNYRLFFVSDANATRDDATHNATLGNILSTFGEVFTTDEVLGLLPRER
jgi:ureidoacrylate peracid hydrolase